jgi:hypothetical protein
MKIVKKMLSILAIVIVTLIVLLIVAVTVFGNQALKIGVETGATAALKVGVTLNSAKLSILGGKVELDGLKVQNPAGYQNPEFLNLQKAAVALKVSSLMSDTIEIDKIQFDEIQLTIEQKGVTTNNLQEILNALPKSEETAPKPEDKTAPKTPGKKMLIHELAINGVQVRVKLLPIPGKADTVTLKLTPIVMKELGGDKPINVAELSAKILKAIAGGIAEQGKDLLPIDMIGSIGQGIAQQGLKVLDTAGQVGKGVLEGAGKGVLDGAGDVGKGVGGLLKGIIPKKEEK